MSKSSSRRMGWPQRLSGLVIGSLFLSSTTASPIHEVKDHLGAVASENKICSDIGIELLRRGGNAADALVGTVLCVGTIGMYHSGIGGGGFMLVRAPDGTYESIDFRETAPAAAFEDMYQGNVLGSVFGGLSAGVPGEVKGLEYLHQKYGVLSWREVCNPAVHVAREGFPVGVDLVRYMNSALKFTKSNFLVDDPEWAKDFAPNGTLVQLGDIITRKRYADTLEKIGKHGSKAFYEGEIAEGMIRAIQGSNGTMTLDDLKNYNISIRDPIEIDYRGYRLVSTGVPSSGAVALSTLKTMEGYALDPAGLNLSTHRLTEAMRFAYAAHAELGDPEFVAGMDTFEADMLLPSTAAAIREKISDNATKNVTEYDPRGFYTAESHGTSHIVTADKSGMSITLTTTINLIFGSGLMVPESGIIMNDEMNDFSIPGVSNAFGFVPSPANFIRPGKRPLSSITPVIVEYPDGGLYVSTGAAGGSRIITGTTQALWHVLDHGMTMPEALAQPRLHDQLMPNEVRVEWSYDNGTVEFLRERGHNITYIPLAETSMQGLRLLPNGTFEAASEPRQKNSGGLAL